jgi:hypothetical protein
LCVHCAVSSVHCPLYSVRCALYRVHCVLYSVHCALYSVRCALYSVHCVLYNVHCALYSVHCAMCSVHHVYTRHLSVETEGKKYSDTYLDILCRWRHLCGESVQMAPLVLAHHVRSGPSSARSESWWPAGGRHKWPRFSAEVAPSAQNIRIFLSLRVH